MLDYIKQRMKEIEQETKTATIMDCQYDIPTEDGSMELLKGMMWARGYAEFTVGYGCPHMEHVFSLWSTQDVRLDHWPAVWTVSRRLGINAGSGHHNQAKLEHNVPWLIEGHYEKGD